MDSAGKVTDWGHLHVYMYNAHSTEWYMYMYVCMYVCPTQQHSHLHNTYTLHKVHVSNGVVCEVHSAVVLEPQLMTCYTICIMCGACMHDGR